MSGRACADGFRRALRPSSVFMLGDMGQVYAWNMYHIWMWKYPGYSHSPAFRHGGQCNFMFCDFHVEAWTEDRLLAEASDQNQLHRWSPY